MRVAAAEYGFVVAQPEAALVGNAWDTLEGSEDVSFALAVVADVATRASIDPARVYATGYSAGGGMAARLGCDAAETFAAIAVIAGAHIGHRRCAPTTPVPILAVYGDADIIVPYGGLGPLPEIEAWAGDWADRNGCPTQAAISSVAEDVTATRWGPCDRSVAVTLYTVAGGGHGWPGTPDPDRVGDTTESISATDLIWEFFTSHPRR